jgi:hypothetical protein
MPFCLVLIVGEICVFFGIFVGTLCASLWGQYVSFVVFIVGTLCAFWSVLWAHYMPFCLVLIVEALWAFLFLIVVTVCVF